MAVRRVQLRRGTTAENNAFTGAVGEITVDTTTESIRVHNGADAGGVDLLRADMSNNASITSDIRVTGSIVIGPALGANTITLGEETSIISIPGTLNVTTQNTTNDLLVQDRVIVLADGSEGNAHDANATDGDSIGIIFTRPLQTVGEGGAAQNPGVFYFDEENNYFALGTADVTELDNSWNADFTAGTLSLGALNVNDGNITNVADIALDSISADNTTISISLKQAGVGSAFSIADDGGVTHLTIDATNGSEKLIIDSPTFEVDANTATSILGSVVVNEGGVDKDFRVEGVGEANALFVQGSDGFVGIANGAPTAQLEVTGNSILDGAVSLNTGRADVDFNVATSNAGGLLNSLFVQGSDGFVGINNGAPSFNLDVIGTVAVSDVARFSEDVDIRNHINNTNGITFNKGIGGDASATLLRVDKAGSFSTLSWNTTRFVWDTDLQITSGGVLLGDGSNATTISVPDQSDVNTSGENLTISAGIGNGTGSGGSLIFQTGGDNGGALSTVLTLDKDNKATFTGDIDISDGAVIGASVVAGESLTLGGNVTSTVITAGDLQVTGNTIKSSGNDAIELSGANVDVLGSLEVSGDSILQSDSVEVMSFSGDANKTVTFSGNISVTTSISTDDDLIVKGGDITLGDGTNATTLSVETQTAADTAGENLTISAGVGNGTGTGGSLIFQTGGDNGGALSTVLTLDKDNKATFTGDIDISDGAVIGSSVGAGESLTLGGNATSTVITAGDLQVTGNTVSSSGGVALELTNSDVEVRGDLTVTGNTVSSSGGVALQLTNSDVEVRGDLTVTGNDIKDSAGTASITFSGDSATTTLTATTTVLSGDLRINGNDILSGDGTTTITMANDGSLTTIGGDLKISGNGIQDSAGTESIAFSGDSATTTLTATTTVLSGDLKVSGNTIQSNTAEAIELSGANVTTKGDLTVEGRDMVLGTSTGGATTISVPTHGTLNTAGHNLTISAGRGNGTGSGGDLVLQTGGANGAALADVLTLDSAKLASFSGSVVIAQDLTVNGTTTTIDTNQLTIEDPVILLNKNANADGVGADRDLGIFMERRAQDAALVYWDEGADRFIFATTTAEASVHDFGGTTTLQTVQALGLELDGGSLVIDSGNNDFVIDQDGVLTSKNTASFDVSSATALTVEDNGTFALKIDTVASEVETAKIIPLANNTHDIGAVGNVFATGHFTDLQIATLTATSTLSFEGASPLNIETTATNGITFRSNADADVLGGADAVLLRVAEGDTTFSSLSWDDSYDGFSFSSKSNSVSDFGVGTVGAETFYVTAGSGDVNIEGDITASADEAKAIFASVTTATITLGGGGLVSTAGDLKVTGNTIQSSGGVALEFTNSDVEVRGDLTVTGNDLIFGNGATITNTDANTLTVDEQDVILSGDLTVQGADVVLGTDADATPTTLAPLARSGADKSGNSITIKGGQSTGTGAGGDLVLQTAITGQASNAIGNSFQTIMTLNTAGEVVLGTDGGGQEIIRAEASTGAVGNDLVIASGVGQLDNGTDDGSLILRSGDATVLTLDTDELATFSGDVHISGDTTIATTKSLTLNSGAAGADADIVINRNGGNDAVLRWVEGTSRFEVDRATGGTFYHLLDESDELFTLTGANGGQAISVTKEGAKGLTLEGENDIGSYQLGLEFVSDGANTITAKFGNTVLMPDALTTAGETTTLNQFKVALSANQAHTAMTLNYNKNNAPVDAEDVTIAVERGTANNATLTWDEGDDRWTLDQGEGSTNAIVTVKRSEGARPETVGTSNNGGGGDLEFGTAQANRLDLTAQQPTAYENEHIYFLNNNGTIGTVDLFTLAGTTYNGYKINFVNTDAVNMVIDAQTQAGQTINGQNTQTIPSGGTLSIVAYGTAWYIL